MAPRWQPPTYADAMSVAPEAVVRCPGCRRRVPAEMLYDLQQLPAAAARHRGGGRFACDACREDLFRRGHTAKADYLDRVGAPRGLVDRHRAASRPPAPA